MGSNFFKILLWLYFYFQCFCTLFNVFVSTGLYTGCWLIYILGNVYSSDIIKCTVNALKFALFITPFIAMYGFYSFVTAMAAVATRKIIKHQKLTKFQIFSMIVFPIMTIPVFIVLILKTEIYLILEFNKMLVDYIISLFYPGYNQNF